MAGFSISYRPQRAWGLLATIAAVGGLPACALWSRHHDAAPPVAAEAREAPVAPEAAAAPDASDALAAPAAPAAPAAAPATGSTASSMLSSGTAPPVDTAPLSEPAPAKPASGRVAGAAATSSSSSKPAKAAHAPAANAARTAAAAGAASAASGGAPSGAAIRPTQPALDLAALEQRLKDTKAIGVFTKLSLKNQVDDLLDEFKKYHQTAGAQSPPPSLRSQYDLLMIKVLSLLQDGDPQLAASISSSREALWDILKDPNKFAKI